MFSSRKRLQCRTSAKDLDRPDYLQALVTEFQTTSDEKAKDQVLANLANFAYDPINYEYLRELHVVDLFIDCIELDEDINGNIVQFGIGGLCNLSADMQNRKAINEHPRALSLIVRCLSSSTEETVLSALTTLIQLIDDSSRQHIVTPPVIECMKRFASMPNVRFKNLAEIFLADYCTQEERFSTTGVNSFLHIPVPISQ